MYKNVGLEGYVRRIRPRPNISLVAEFYAHLIEDEAGKRAHSIVRGVEVRLSAGTIRRTLSIPVPPPGVPSFVAAVEAMPTLSPSYIKACERLTDEPVTRRLTAGRLKRGYILPNLFNKYDMVPSGTTAELYGKDVVLFQWLLDGTQFDFGDMVYSGIINCSNLAIAHLSRKSQGGVNLIFPSMITEMCISCGAKQKPTDTFAKPKEALSDHTVMKSLSQHRAAQAAQGQTSGPINLEEEEDLATPATTTPAAAQAPGTPTSTRTTAQAQSTTQLTLRDLGSRLDAQDRRIDAMHTEIKIMSSLMRQMAARQGIFPMGEEAATRESAPVGEETPVPQATTVTAEAPPPTAEGGTSEGEAVMTTEQLAAD